MSAIVLTRNIESLSDKNLPVGELPFCALGIPGELSEDVFVPEDQYVKPGQRLKVFLSGNPWQDHALEVRDVAPIAEILSRQGSG